MTSICLRTALRASLSVPRPHVATFVSPWRGVVTVANADGSLRRPTAATDEYTDTSQPAAVLRKQLLYRSKQRGWLELDLILGTWAEQHLDRLNEAELVQYEAVVRRENPDLIKWLVERVEVPADANNAIMQQLIHYTHGAGKSWIRKKGNQA